MALEMQQQIVCLCLEPEAELPLAFRLRRSWSAGDIWDLRKESDDDSELSQDCADAECTISSDKFDDSASTCTGGDDMSSRSDDTSSECCIESPFESPSPRMNWADEMDEMWEPEVQETVSAPPGQWQSVKLVAPPGMLQVPAENTCAVSGKSSGRPQKFEETKTNRQKRIDRKYRRQRLQEQGVSRK